MASISSNSSNIIIPGVGPDTPTTTNEAGGKQSLTPYRCDLLPVKATLAVAKVLATGAAKYGDNNWRKIPAESHLNHAMTHILAFLGGDGSDSHLENASCRTLMALEMAIAAREESRRRNLSISNPGLLKQSASDNEIVIPT